MNDRGELVSGGWARNGRVSFDVVSLTDYKRRKETVQAKIGFSGDGSVQLSPDGKRLAWFVWKQMDSRPASLDGWFFYQELWITRADGSNARHVANLASTQSGMTEDGPDSVYWKADSSGMCTQIGDCFYSLD